MSSTTREDVNLESKKESLRQEHARLDARIRELDRHLSLTSSEELERARLKKLKLRVKDELQHLSR